MKTTRDDSGMAGDGNRAAWRAGTRESSPDVQHRVLLPVVAFCLLLLVVLVVYCEATFAIVFSSHALLPYGVFSVVAVGLVCWVSGWLLLVRHVRAAGSLAGEHAITPMGLATRVGLWSAFCCLANAGIRITITSAFPILDASACLAILAMLADISLLGLILAGLSVFVRNLRQQANFYVLWLFSVTAVFVMSVYSSHVLFLFVAGI